MKGLFKHVKGDKIIRWGVGVSVSLVIFELIYSAIFYFFLPPYIPLFNQMPWGDNRLGLKEEIFLPIVIIFFFILLNFFLLNKLYERMPLISRIISITTLLVTILSFIFIIRTLQLVL